MCVCAHVEGLHGASLKKSHKVMKNILCDYETGLGKSNWIDSLSLDEKT